MQEYSADDINRRHFQMQVLLGVLRVNDKYFFFFSQKLGLDIPFNPGPAEPAFANNVDLDQIASSEVD